VDAGAAEGPDPGSYHSRRQFAVAALAMVSGEPRKRPTGPQSVPRSSELARTPSEPVVHLNGAVAIG